MMVTRIPGQPAAGYPCHQVMFAPEISYPENRREADLCPYFFTGPGRGRHFAP